MKNMLDDLPLTSLFIGGKDNLKEKSALSWLKSLTIEQVLDVRDAGVKMNSITEEQAMKGEDNNSLDFMSLVWVIATFEKNSQIDEINLDAHVKATVAFVVLVDFEIMRRRELVVINGDGKITDLDSTIMTLTDKGQVFQDSLKTVGDIVNLMTGE